MSLHSFICIHMHSYHIVTFTYMQINSAWYSSYLYFKNFGGTYFFEVFWNNFEKILKNFWKILKNFEINFLCVRVYPVLGIYPTPSYFIKNFFQFGNDPHVVRHIQTKLMWICLFCMYKHVYIHLFLTTYATSLFLWYACCYNVTNVYTFKKKQVQTFTWCGLYVLLYT